jgi:hypothetical protein
MEQRLVLRGGGFGMWVSIPFGEDTARLVGFAAGVMDDHMESALGHLPGDRAWDFLLTGRGEG